MSGETRKPKEPHRLQEDAPEGDRATIERELQRQSEKQPDKEPAGKDSANDRKGRS